MMRGNFCSLAVAVLIANAATVSAQGIVFADNFDGYGDQTAFAASWTPNATHVMLAGNQVASLPNSVQGALTATRSAHGFTATTPDTALGVRFSFDFYDSNGAAPAYRQYAEMDVGLAPTLSGQLIAMGLNNTLISSHYCARVLGVDGGAGASSFFKLDGPGAPTRVTGWHNLAVDVYTDHLDFFVDSVLSKSVSVGFTPRPYDTVKVGSNVSSTQIAYFDNVSVQTFSTTPVPEPSALLALGGLLGAFVLRRRT